MDQLALANILFYLAIAIAQYMQLIGKIAIKKITLLAACLVSSIIHAYLLYRWIDVDTSIGQNLSLTNVFSFITWLMVIFISISAFKKPVTNLLLLILPVAGLSIAVTTLFPSYNFFQLQSMTIDLSHIFISLISFSILCLAAIQAILIAVQNYCLKKSHFNNWLNLMPPLEIMENLLFQIIKIGFIFLSITVIAAMLYFNHELLQNHLLKLIISCCAWLLFATLLYGHYKAGWRGPIAVKSTLAGVILLFIAYFGSKIWMEYL